MSPEEESEFRELLLTERDRVVSEITSMRKAEANTKLPAGAEAAERANMEVERGFEHRHRLDDEHLIEKIDLALERLENGSYEFCAECAELIGMERLRAKPSVSLCHVCQIKKENGATVEAVH